MKTYNHVIDLAFSIDSPCENWEDIPFEDLMRALLQRVRTLDIEAFGLVDTIENEGGSEG